MGVDMECIQKFGRESSGRCYLEDQEEDGRITLSRP
jgi:hypothetical protein